MVDAPEESAANARLIAAAPELLEQLIDYRDTDSRHDHKDDCDCETCLLISRIQAYQGTQEKGNRND